MSSILKPFHLIHLAVAAAILSSPSVILAQNKGLIVPDPGSAPSAVAPAAAPAASSPRNRCCTSAELAQIVAKDPNQRSGAATSVSAAIASARDSSLVPAPSAAQYPEPRQVAAAAPPAQATPLAPQGVKSVSAPSPAAAVLPPTRRAESSSPPAPQQSAAAPLPPSKAAAASPAVPAADPQSTVPARAPVATVQRRADGSQVFRTPVTPSMLAEEQRVAAATQPPAVAVPGFPVPPSVASAPPSQPPAAPSAQAPTALASFLGASTAGLPKWATEGVGKTNGKTRLVVSQGVTEMVTIARNFPNRFITPFEAAEVVTTDEGLAHDGVGGAVILSTASDKPIGIFIQDRFSDRSIGLVLMPEDVPQRELRLVLDETWTSPVLRPNPEQSQAQVPTASSDFVEFLKSTLRSMAKGEVPDGHALTPIDPEIVPRCQVPGLAFKPAQMLEGPTTRIAVYVATNPGASTAPFQEAGCYRKGVLAVSAFPRPVLEPGQSTEVYVVLRKDVVTQTVTGKRRPVLVSQ